MVTLEHANLRRVLDNLDELHTVMWFNGSRFVDLANPKYQEMFVAAMRTRDPAKFKTDDKPSQVCQNIRMVLIGDAMAVKSIEYADIILGQPF